MNLESWLIAGVVFVAGLAVFRARAGGNADIRAGYTFDSSLGGYVKRLPDGSLRWLT